MTCLYVCIWRDTLSPSQRQNQLCGFANIYILRYSFITVVDKRFSLAQGAIIMKPLKISRNTICSAHEYKVCGVASNAKLHITAAQCGSKGMQMYSSSKQNHGVPLRWNNWEILPLSGLSTTRTHWHASRRASHQSNCETQELPSSCFDKLEIERPTLGGKL